MCVCLRVFIKEMAAYEFETCCTKNEKKILNRIKIVANIYKDEKEKLFFLDLFRLTEYISRKYWQAKWTVSRWEGGGGRKLQSIIEKKKIVDL